jgi:O-antigen ligase
MTSPAPLPAVEDVVAQHHSGEAPSSVVLYGAGSLLLFGPLAFGATTAAPLFVLQAGSALLFCVWIVQLAKPGPQQIWLNPLFWPILAFGVLIAIQLTTGRTVAKGQTLSAAGLFATYGLLCFLLVQSFRRSRQVEVIARAVTIYGAAVALFALLQDASSNGKLYWVQPSEGWIYGPYSNHNHYAGLMEMLTPVPLVIALSSRTSRQTRWLAGMAASIMAASLLLSGSRGGMTAFAAEMVLLAILLRRQRMDAKTMGVMAASLVLALVLFGWLAQPQLTERLAAIPSGTKAELSGGTRLTIDRDTLRMFAQRPLLGWGLGSFPDVYPRFCSFYATLPVDRAHNDYLQLLAEMGIAGFAITMYSLFIALRGALRKIQQDPLGTNGLIGLSVLLGISGILVHSLLDFNLEIPANAAIFYALCTVAAMERRFGRHRHRHLRG